MNSTMTLANGIALTEMKTGNSTRSVTWRDASPVSMTSPSAKGTANYAGPKFGNPMDRHFFAFTGIAPEAPLEQMKSAAGDWDILQWVNSTNNQQLSTHNGRTLSRNPFHAKRARRPAALLGNRQMLSTGNLVANDRVAFFLMDYPRRERLKILGHARVEDAREHPDLVAQCSAPDVRGIVERVFLIEVVSFDWNCPKYITPRYSQAEVNEIVAPLKQRIAELEAPLVCAARGCPPLREEVYVADHLEEQLDAQARQFLDTSTKNRVDDGARTVYLSPIFKWYGADFEKKHGSVLAALQPYWPKTPAAPAAGDGFRIRYTDYDWSLNQTTR
jgi:predicted pyridoxine 5'-phosphate oxidase superfamily flavin-nucleotide-binding protein